MIVTQLVQYFVTNKRINKRILNLRLWREEIQQPESYKKDFEVTHFLTQTFRWKRQNTCCISQEVVNPSRGFIVSTTDLSTFQPFEMLSTERNLS